MEKENTLHDPVRKLQYFDLGEFDFQEQDLWTPDSLEELSPWLASCTTPTEDVEPLPDVSF